ncbi:MAG: thioesterase family protein [Dehalococcoidia bacterium]
MTTILDNANFKAVVDYFGPIFQEKPSFGKFLEHAVESPDLDTPILTFQMRDDFVGNLLYRTLHGGVIASMLDAVGGHAVWLKAIKDSKGEPVEKLAKRVARIGSIDMRIDYLQPGRGEMFKASASILRMGNKVAVVRMSLHNENEELIAVGTGSYTTG